MYFGKYKSHAVPYFLSTRFLPLDFLYFISVAVPEIRNLSENKFQIKIHNILLQQLPEENDYIGLSVLITKIS